MPEEEISFEELLKNLEKLKDIDSNINKDEKRSLQRRRSNVFGGSGFRGGAR